MKWNDSNFDLCICIIEVQIFALRKFISCFDSGRARYIYGDEHSVGKSLVSFGVVSISVPRLLIQCSNDNDLRDPPRAADGMRQSDKASCLSDRQRERPSSQEAQEEAV